jgi:hypothetical protein
MCILNLTDGINKTLTFGELKIWVEKRTQNNPTGLRCPASNPKTHPIHNSRNNPASLAPKAYLSSCHHRGLAYP